MAVNRAKENIETLDDAERRRQRQVMVSQPLVALLDQWMTEDVEDLEKERAAFFAFIRGIDESRGEGRKLYENIHE